MLALRRTIRVGVFAVLLLHGSGQALFSAEDGNASPGAASSGNRLTYLDDFCDPYYVGRTFPKLTTPQWVGEPGVDAVVVLAIDDMRGHGKYEAYLRPILERLKQIDGRAPVSIMTNRIDPQQPHLQKWLDEGLSLEVHTFDHPCPCLNNADFAAARTTYEKCVDLMSSIPGSRPVAFRMPCCDSMNTPSPRFFVEIFNRTTPQGHFLTLDSSVFNVTTPHDPELPRELVIEDGRPRFEKYLPWDNFVNTIEDYPYPYVIARLGWQFPCMVPSDWEAQHLHRPNNPRTVRDMQAALDAVVIKRGVYNLVFHPHGWIRNDQINEIIDHAVEKHGSRVKFLTFREAQQRIDQHLLAGQPLRAADGSDNGVRLLDVNNDGHLDVVIGNRQRRETRIWSPQENQVKTTGFPVSLVSESEDGPRRDAGVRFGVLRADGRASLLVSHQRERGVWHFDGKRWVADKDMLAGLELEGERILTSREGVDQGVRLRDLDGDGVCELIVGRPGTSAVFCWKPEQHQWKRLPFGLPPDVQIVDQQGRDGGLRLVDVNDDGHDDVVFSDDARSAVHLFESMEKGWATTVISARRDAQSAMPPIVREGTNNGAFFARDHIWWQNEQTGSLPDKVDRRSFRDWLARLDTGKGADTSQTKTPTLAGIDLARTDNIAPLAAADSLAAIRTHPQVRVELVASEPLVADPVAIDWGPDGRLWVVEMGDYPRGIDGEGQPGGRVKFLEDTDGDGHYDRSTVFLDNLPFPTGVKVWREGVLVAAAPKIFYAEDTDGDRRADQRRTLYEGFGEGNQQHRVNGLRWGLDNWLHVGNGDSGGSIRSTQTGETVSISKRDLRIRPDQGQLDPASGNTQYGINRDDWGNWFGGNNSNPIWHYVLEDHYLRRNPHFAPPDARRHISQQPGAAPVYPISRTLKRFNNPNSAGRFTSACSPMIYRDDLLGKEFAGNAFVCEPVHNLLHREIVSSQGVTFTSRRAEEEQQSEFLASRDNWFRPVMVRTGPDGCLWLVDMYRFVIEHPKWIPDEFQQQLDLRAGDRLGRIYRIVPREAEPRKVPRLDQATTAQLVQSLESPNGWQRDMSQQMLIWRNDPAAVELLFSLLNNSDDPLARLHALCTLDGLQKLSVDALERGLGDKHPGVRRHAVRLTEGFLDRQGARLGPRLLALLDQADPQVIMQLAYTLPKWRDPRSGEALGKLLLRHHDDNDLVAACLSSINGDNLAHVLDRLFAQGNAAPAKLIEQLMPMVVALGDDPARLAVWERLTAGGDKHVTGPRLQALAELYRHLRLAKKDLPGENGSSDPRTATVLHKLKRLAASARNLALDTGAKSQDRVAAVRLLCSVEDLDGKSQIFGELLSPRQPVNLQQAVVEELADRGDPAVPAILLEAWESHTPTIRRQVVTALISRSDWVERLLAEMEGERIQPTHLDPRSRQLLVGHRDAAIAKRAKRLLSTSGDGNRQEILQRYQAALRNPGDHQRGGVLFKKHCANCHRLEKIGHAVGPDLAALTDRSPQALLTAILDPNRAVEEKYLDYAVITTDGRTSGGMLAAETGASITLRGPAGKDQVILRKEIDLLRATGNSLMPQGIEKDLNPADVADLIAYLRSHTPPPKPFPGNHPQIVEAAADGSLHLPATHCRIYGSSIVFEKKYRNLGYWSGQQDHAVWSVQTKSPGKYRVTLDYACADAAAGNTLSVACAENRLSYKVTGTGTWDDYRSQEIGTMELPAGTAEIVVAPGGPLRGALIDLRGLTLTPDR